MLRMITGAAWASPSKTAVSEMVSRATALRDERFIIIVPEQYTLQTQKTAVSLHPDHACMNIDVVSFDRVAHVVLSKLGKDINEVLDDTGKALILRSVLEECSEDLAVYRSKIHMPGFIEELKSLITEFRQYRVDDNMLYLMQEDAALKGGLLYYKLQDIRLIYRRFNEKVEEDYATSEEILDIFERLMLQSDFLKDTHIYLDGFTGFTPVQLRIIRNMLTQAKDVTCAVTVPEDRIRTDCPEYDLFYLANETIFKLCRIAEEEACGIEHISADRNISLSDADSLKNIHIVSCRSSRDEAAYAARQILKLVRKEGRRFSDIAVMTADMESYYSILKSTFEDAGIPAFIDHKEEFSGNMLVRFIISALEVASKGMLYEQMFAFLKSGLSMIDYDECALLENYCLEFNIRGRGRWESGFTANRELKGGEYAWDLDRINDIRSRACTGIAAFYGTASGGRHKAVLFTKALRKLMNELDVRSRIEALSLRFEEEGNLTAALQYSQICDKAEELLDKIDLILGSRELDVKEFEDIVLSGIEEIRIGTIPPSMDAVIAGDLTRTRLGDISYLFILGMNEGRVPSAGSGSVLFTQRERTSLRKDYEIAPTVQENIYIQRYYLYLAFTKPEEALYITYPKGSPEGEIYTPSVILEDLSELIPDRHLNENGQEEGCPEGGVRILKYSAPQREGLWKRDAVLKTASRLRDMASEGCFEGDDLIAWFAKEEPDTIRKLAKGACYSNIKTPLDGQVALDLYGDVLKGSVSRFETFYACPYRHFLDYGLHLEERREYKVEVTDLGTIYHEALERYSKKLEEEGVTFRTVSDEDSHRIISECVDAAIDSLDSDVLKSSARNEYFKKRIKQISDHTADILREHVKAGLFEPEEFEYAFDGKISDSVVFKGKIDRIDIYDAGDIFVKIIDYKSGSKKFDIKDIYSGMQLQLAAYLNNAVQAEQKKHPDRIVRPGGVYYYLINDKYIREDEDIESRNKMSGLTLYEDEVIHAIDSGLGEEGKTKSSIIQVNLTKSGYAKSSLLASAEEFDNMISFACRRIEDAGESIRKGDISLNPYRQGDHTGCDFCSYMDICRFRAGRFGTDWREEEKSKEEMEAEVYGRDQMD